MLTPEERTIHQSASLILQKEVLAAGGAVDRGRIREVVSMMAKAMGGAEADLEKIVRELEASFQILIGTETVLEDTDDSWSPWLAKKKADIQWRFWERYRTWLFQGGWAPATVDRLDTITDRVLGLLHDPSTPGSWDRRGLVVGHVQSGKTSNYTGLICKAADAGYKVFIVLAGFHNSLRSQTQIRLEEGFLGYDRAASMGGSARKRVGVGNLLLHQDLRADSVTNRRDNGDFSRSLAANIALHPGGNPLLFVVKKNASVLRNLLNWVRWVAGGRDGDRAVVVRDVPLLLIDDEADQGSVDTQRGAVDEDGRPDPEHDPTVINGLVRQLLRLFSQSAYVGYTATPFASILIPDTARTDRHGEDLFPRSFIISLPAPSNYVGPSVIFGGEKEDGTPEEPLPIIRTVDDHAASNRLDETEGWMPPKHRKDWRPRYAGKERVPPSLAKAIRSFALVCAARAARGDDRAHNSMLVHVSRFVAVQDAVREQVEREVEELRRVLRYGDRELKQALRDEFRRLWEEDFVPTHRAIRARGLAEDCRELKWPEVEPHLEKALVSIEVRNINGTAGDVLDYVKHQDQGLNVIAIGGDKLSRGLTLEGLSVSYFLRASRVYDTLMQMGRWFGYRPRYLDLCRLYTTADLAEWFQHVANATKELLEDFERMAAAGQTPVEFGHRIRCHPTLLVTSQVKMRYGKTIEVTFDGDISETINFWRDAGRLRRNHEVALALLREAQKTAEMIVAGGLWREDAEPGAAGHSVLLHGVPAELIMDFLDGYREHDAALKARTGLLREYIEKQRVQGGLETWSVLVGAGDSRKTWGTDEARVRMVRRGWHGDEVVRRQLREEGRFRIRRLVNPLDEAADLTAEEFAKAMRLTREAWESGGRSGKEPTRPAGWAIREVRPPSRGLLMLYGIDPGDPEEAKVEPDGMQIPIVGFAISFPRVEAGRRTPVKYVVNPVYWRTEFGGEE